MYPMHQVEIEMGWRATRDDGALLGCVVRLHEDDCSTYAYTTTGELRRLGACSCDQAARAVVERAIATDEGARW
jgi:hypothetical protein